MGTINYFYINIKDGFVMAYFNNMSIQWLVVEIVRQKTVLVSRLLSDHPVYTPSPHI